VLLVVKRTFVVLALHKQVTMMMMLWVILALPFDAMILVLVFLSWLLFDWLI
jgi:hypothetical protein